jgi:hypothetical protein
MYGLAEYALLRQQLHERNKRTGAPKEFDYALTQPAPKRKRRPVQRMGRLMVSRRALRLFRRLGA